MTRFLRVVIELLLHLNYTQTFRYIFTVKTFAIFFYFIATLNHVLQIILLLRLKVCS